MPELTPLSALAYFEFVRCSVVLLFRGGGGGGQRGNVLKSISVPEITGLLKSPLFARVFFSLACQDNEKRTPLHAAAYLGDAEIIELLVLSGRDSSSVYTCGRSLPLYAAGQNVTLG